MNYIGILDMDNECLAQYECKCVLEAEPIERYKNLLFFDTINTAYLSHLTYTKYVARIEHTLDIDNTLETLGSITCSQLIVIKPKEEKRISSIQCKNTVNKDPKKDVYILVSHNDQVHIGKVFFENDKSFLDRHPQKRPEHHPATILPKLARAAINCSGINKGSMQDPLCGVGGIIIEGAILGFETHGSDINDFMLKKAHINIDFYSKLYKSAPTISQQDALKTNQKVDAIITDLPYSKTTTKIDDLEKFYTDCLHHFKSNTKRAVIMFPDFTPNKKIIAATGWNIQHTCTYYLHRSLSKEIYVLTH